MFSIKLIITDGEAEEDPLHGLHARQIRVLWIFNACGHVNAAPVDNEETHQRRIVDVCQTFRNCPGNS
jgi:hypothetical protein